MQQHMGTEVDIHDFKAVCPGEHNRIGTFLGAKVLSMKELCKEHKMMLIEKGTLDAFISDPVATKECGAWC